MARQPKVIPVPRRTLPVWLIIAGGLLLAGCGTDPGDSAESGSRSEELGHVHGLGTDPADGTLYAASHFGVFRLREEGTAERVADRWQDTMAFTVVGPNRFLGSGHPDLDEDLPAHLGLIESTDAAETWSPLSLQGEADFHALEATADLIVGYDSLTGQLLASPDGKDWRLLAKAEVVDLAMNPSDHSRVLATTPQGSIVEYSTEGDDARPIEGTPPLVFIDWPEADLLVGLAQDGALYLSDDEAQTWRPVEGPPGDPQALDVATGSWHVATSQSIFRSTDDGRTWDDLGAPAQ